jgi:hypothetical protein
MTPRRIVRRIGKEAAKHQKNRQICENADHHLLLY